MFGNGLFFYFFVQQIAHFSKSNVALLYFSSPVSLMYNFSTSHLLFGL